MAGNDSKANHWNGIHQIEIRFTGKWVPLRQVHLWYEGLHDQTLSGKGFGTSPDPLGTRHRRGRLKQLKKYFVYLW
jgi:hypothetical protein